MAKNRRNAVEVRNIKKSFYLPHYKNNSLKTAITQVFKNKDKGGDTFHVLNDVSFNVEKGDFFGILGRNGSGKSTLLKIISEIYRPDSGKVKTRGKVVSFIELGVGFKAELSGRENVFLNGALLDFSKQEVEDMYDDIVSFAELEKFMDQKLKNYSSGMRVRLAFSVAIRARADILILDEVLAVGDAEFQKKCTNYFETLKEDGKTVILVTHNMGHVKRFCNKAIVIEGGKVIHDGDAKDAAEKYTGLFAKPEPKPKPEPSDKVEQKQRSGSGEIKLSSVNTSINDRVLKIETEIVSKDYKDSNVVVAINILDSKGVPVTGIESVNCDGSRVLNFHSNEAKSVVFEMDNLFGTDDYSVNVIVRKNDTKKVFDYWRGASAFSNYNSKDYNKYFAALFPARLVDIKSIKKKGTKTKS